MTFCVYLAPQSLAGLKPYAALRLLAPKLSTVCLANELETTDNHDQIANPPPHEGTYSRHSVASPPSNKLQDKMSTFEQVVSLTSAYIDYFAIDQQQAIHRTTETMENGQDGAGS